MQKWSLLNGYWVAEEKSDGKARETDSGSGQELERVARSFLGVFLGRRCSDTPSTVAIALLARAPPFQGSWFCHHQAFKSPYPNWRSWAGTSSWLSLGHLPTPASKGPWGSLWLLEIQSMKNFPQLGRTSRCWGAQTQPMSTINALI